MGSQVPVSELKARLLELLERDKEFRYAVAGLIGLGEILEKLRGHDEKFNEILEELRRHGERLEEHSRRLEEHDRKFNEVLAELREQRRILEEHSRRLEEHSRILREHSRILMEHSKVLEEHSARIEELSTAVRDLALKVAELSRYTSVLGDSIGALTEATLARFVYEELREALERRGERVEHRVRGAVVDEEEMDLLIVTDRRVYVVEVKAMPGHEDVGALLAKAEVVRRHYPDREVVAVLAGARIGRGVAEYARGRGVLVYSY